MKTELNDTFLQLVRLGIGTKTYSSLRLFEDWSGKGEHPVSSVEDWERLKTIAAEQGLLAIALDGLEKLDANGVAVDMPKIVRLEWIGEVLKMEQQYDVQQKAAGKMALLFHQNGIMTYVLKGEVVSECYPNLNHRVSADLDCFLTEAFPGPKFHDSSDVWERGNKAVENAGFAVSRGFYKNSSFLFMGLHVENHKFLTPFRGNKKLTSLERLLQAMLKANDKNHTSDFFPNTYLCRPPVMVSALFLIEHAYSHFLHEGLTWRHVLDWMMFSQKHHDEIDWTAFDAFIDEFGFRRFYDANFRLGRYMLGELKENELTVKEKRMMADIWAPLDLHETLYGIKGKLRLVGNTMRATWKYRYFGDVSMIHALWIQVKGFLFMKNPKLD